MQVACNNTAKRRGPIDQLKGSLALPLRQASTHSHGLSLSPTRTTYGGKELNDIVNQGLPGSSGEKDTGVLCSLVRELKLCFDINRYPESFLERLDEHIETYRIS